MFIDALRRIERGGQLLQLETRHVASLGTDGIGGRSTRAAVSCHRR
jgi:hypothetical protein